MKNSKIVQYIGQLSLSQTKRFRLFVTSPYFNQHQKTIELLDFILKQKKAVHPTWQREKVAQKLFATENNPLLSLNNSMTYLMRLLKKFLAYDVLENKPIASSLLLLEGALERQQFKLFESSSHTLEKNLTKGQLKNQQILAATYSLYQTLDDYEQEHGNRTSPVFLQKTIDTLDAYYFSEKLRHTCHALARQNVVGGHFQLDFITEMIGYLRANLEQYSVHPPIIMYYQIYQMLSDPKGLIHYQHLKTMLPQQVAFFSKKEARDLYRYAENYCILNINQGQTNYVQELFELYQQLLGTGLILNQNILHQWDYTNIIALGCRLKQFNWTVNFIETYRSKLADDIRDNAYSYNLAFFHYEQQHYDEALELLNNVEFTDVYYQLSAKLILLKAWFETENWRALDYMLETFRIYLLRNKYISKSRQKSGFNLIRFTRQLFQLKEKQAQLDKAIYAKKIENLKIKIEACEQVMNKKWLLLACEANSIA